MSRLAYGRCGKCSMPLRTLKGKWSGTMPLGYSYWLCKPCEYLNTSRTTKGGDPVDGVEIPDDFKPEWNR